MANKYIRHGATFNGDGTAPNAALSNGGVGAWNDLSILTGTPPPAGSTLGAGDVVYIRSKDQSGADIVVTVTAAVTFGSSAATETAPITWVLDNGTVWPGAVGTLTYRMPSTYYTTAVLAYNIIESKVRGALHVEFLGTNPADAQPLVTLNLGARTIGWKTTGLNVNTTSPRFVIYRMFDGSVVETPIIKLSMQGFDISGYGDIFSAYGNSGRFVVIDPDIEITTNTANGWSGLVCNDGAYQRDWLILGGRLYGAGATTGRWVVNTPYYDGSLGSTVIHGLSYPKTMSPTRTVPNGSQNFALISITGSDGGLGAFAIYRWGWLTSRTDENPPYLGAEMPNLATEIPNSTRTPWSWRVYPRNATNRYSMDIPTTKMYVGDPGVKTLTLEFLVSTSYAGLNRRNVWATFTYIEESTGLTRTVSTLSHAAEALDASTAPWSATVWGPISFNKRKLSITTPTAVKKDTLIICTMFCTKASASGDDIFFVDPDFGVI